MSENELLVAKWYVLHAYSGREYRVKELIKERLASLGGLDKVVDILVPDEEQIKITKNKRKIVKKKSFPGYVLIKILVKEVNSKRGVEYEIDDSLWYLIRNTEGVSGFIGGSNPAPISDKEVETIKSRMERYSSAPKIEVNFKIGERVEIINGSFIGNIGKIDFIDPEHNKLTVMINIFNRLAPVEVSFDEIAPA